MDSRSHTPGGGRERYERIATTANEVAQVVIALAQGAPTPLDLVVQNITTLIDDAAALSASTPRSPSILPTPITTNRGATAFPPPSLARAIRQVATLDEQIATRSSGLTGAISDAKQACKELAAVRGRPDPSLLHAIGAALRRISTCSQTLGRLVHERTVAVSSFDGLPHVRSPISAFGSVGRATRQALASPRSFVSPPAPAFRDVDDERRRGPRITGPTAL
jgi:hypothetical protein